MRRVLLACLLAWPAMAYAQAPTPRPATPVQAPAQASAAAGAEAPDRTSASFGDWTMRCEVLRPQGQPATRSCEVVLTVADQRGQPVLLLAVGRPARTEPLRIIAHLPIELRVDQPARLLPDPAAPLTEGVTLPLRLCSAARGGCFAELELRDDVALRRLRARGDNPGRMDFRDSAGREVQVPFSLRGFGPALDAMMREAG
ncbi:MAG: invasion associated locus B family protein [Alphaproteobacteria bacterium]|nr:invasion associated locus B family protein [Alphaproteobacteria bacterium]